MAKPTFTVTLSVEEMEILAQAMIDFTTSDITDAEAEAADSLLDKFTAEVEKQKDVRFVL